MKTLPLLLLAFTAFSARALDVGQFGPCVVLEDLQTDGTVKTQCIRTPLKKGQFVVLEYFSPKCEDCKDNLPTLDTLAADIRAKATTRLIGVDKDKETILSFLEEHDTLINVPVSFDLEHRAYKAYGVAAVPTLFVLNNKHTIVFKHIGPLTEDTATAIKKIVQ